MARALEIRETLEGNVRVLALVGRLDTNTSPQLSDVANRINEEDKEADVVLEMGQCDFVSSAGLRVIVTMQKRATVGGSLKLRNVMPDVRVALASTGIDSILCFE